MRGCLLTLSLFMLIIVGFIVGLVSAQPGLMIAGFFLSPFVFFFGGWSLRGVFNGRRLTLVEVERRPARAGTSSSQRARRLQQADAERPTAEQTL